MHAILGLQLISALVSASFLFLLAAGVWLVFGVSRFLNLAHGSLFMLSGFLAYALSEVLLDRGGFWVLVGTVPVLMGLLGAGLERLLIRRFYGAPLRVQLLPMVALIFMISDLCRYVWGEFPKGVPVLGRFGVVSIGGVTFPGYYAVVIAVSGGVALILGWIVQRTRWGRLVRAVAQDREMAAACGVDESRLATQVFAVGTALAGLAGVLVVPISGASLGMDVSAVIDAFVVVVVGGLGSILGAAATAVLVGLTQAFGILVLPQFAIAFVFALMAMVLVVRPKGLFGVD
ncbi:MAG: branched-chain amino acid ABC transporter permease [Armatimonadota bacterium]|nr:branched-chain amino acid ABC transporter permease [Armatimonadota bacterium]MDR7440213.1 branched-chain amino acid ABC transporter permease [Armatimonadota bacterium]MDR7563910.1 branched-chain amino acid ABC transporter permease [Armatimonadota bacterium]MDR7567662.1 branched-chain amino acid ABC transporter permease [Armatimonadota bacterium]MDR7600932.1 branched-chain amino acid ABC transporter permease [Armatimonadota bacterium]